MTRYVRIAHGDADSPTIREQEVVFGTKLFAVHEGTRVESWTVTHRTSGFALMKDISSFDKAKRLARFADSLFRELKVADFTDGRNLGLAAGENWVALKERMYAKKKELFA